MKVPFYGHVRQYQNLKSEIDAKMQEVIQSGQYRHGADAEEIRGGAGGLCRRKTCRSGSATGPTPCG